MGSFATTRMSSKGQVVIPEEVRRKLRLEEGDRFLVLGEGDVVILKAISAPSIKDFDRLVAKARRQAREAGVTKADVSRAIAIARGRV